MYNDELYHFGVKGQKWGQRRYQNKDGSYKSGAEGRYDGDDSNGPKQSGTIKGTIQGIKRGAAVRKENRRLSSENKRLAAENAKYKKKADKAAAKEAKQANKKKFHLSDRQKKALKVGAAVGASVLAAYGAKKLYDHLDANHKGKLLAKKLLDDAGGDFEKAAASYNQRLRQYQLDRGAGALGKYGEKSGKIMEATRKGLADAVRKNTYENSQINKDLQAIKAASRARRKEQFDKATKGLRVGSKRLVSKAKSGSDAVRSRSGDIATRVRSKAGEAAKNARSAYERNAGERMAKSINNSYARRQAMNKARNAASSAANRAANAAKSGAASARSRAGATASRMRNSKLGRAADNVRAVYTGRQSNSQHELRNALIKYRRKHR